jgi:asparagine synthetase B (glutamine-hydrolysing)
VISNRAFEDMKGISATKDGIVAMDGVLFGHADLAELTAPDRIDHLTQVVNSLRGNFVIAVWKPGTITLFTDHFSTRPIYFMHVGGALYFSSELKALLPVGDRKHADSNAFREAFALGYVCGSKTLVKEIKRLGPGSYLHFAVGKATPEIGSYFSVFEKRGMEHETEVINQISESLRAATSRPIQISSGHDYRILATLSAGLDSRVVCAAAADLELGDVTTLTYGESGSFEVDLAERVAEALDSNHRFIPFNGGRWLIEKLDEAVTAGEGMTHVIDTARMLYALETVDPSEYGMLHTGLSGDFVFGSFVRSADLERASRAFSPDELGVSILGRLGMAHWDGLVDLVGEAGEGESFLRGVQASVVRTFDPALLEHDWISAHENWNLHNRQIRGISGYFRGIEQTMEYSTPFYDPELFALGYGLPDKLRLEQVAYVRALRRILPMKLQSLPWQKTGIPIMAGSRSGRWLERLRRAFRRRVSAKLSDDQWRRSTANPYLYWFSKDRKLRELVREELESFERLPMLGLDRNKFRGYLDRWMKDPKPHGRSLLHLIYLLPLKRWIDRYGAQIEF